MDRFPRTQGGSVPKYRDRWIARSTKAMKEVSRFCQHRQYQKLFVTLAIFCCCFALWGCHSAWFRAGKITLTQIPTAGKGGRIEMETISGRVSGFRSGQRIVLYAKTDVWWVQPEAFEPYTVIHPDGTWSNSIHLGSEYAALLVNATYNPPHTTPQLPQVGGGVVAMVVAQGSPVKADAPVVEQEKGIRFSGYKWIVRSIRGAHGGRSHVYDPSNVHVDEQGTLHLKITRFADEWKCSEVYLDRSLGYGTYSFQVEDVSHLEPAAELSLFTWSELGVNQDHHEMDINISQKGDPATKNAEYVIQPYYLPMNTLRFQAPAGPVTYTFDWQPNGISFVSWKGLGLNRGSSVVSDHRFVSDAPVPGGETARINFCPFGFPKIAMQHEAEIVIRHFEYLP